MLTAFAFVLALNAECRTMWCWEDQEPSPIMAECERKFIHCGSFLFPRKNTPTVRPIQGTVFPCNAYNDPVLAPAISLPFPEPYRTNSSCDLMVGELSPAPSSHDFTIIEELAHNPSGCIPGKWWIEIETCAVPLNGSLSQARVRPLTSLAELSKHQWKYRADRARVVRRGTPNDRHPDFIVEPVLWYFDPISPTAQLRRHWYTETSDSNDADNMTSIAKRRTFLDFMLEHRERPQPQQQIYGSTMLFR
jgi:hypothetical protein